MDAIAIRDGGAADAAEIDALYRAALPEEDLRLLLAALPAVPGVAWLVAGGRDSAGGVLGHGALTPCGLAAGAAKVGLLGPLAVAPGRQRRGIGTALVQAVLARAARAGMAAVCVLGDPAYYARHGFRPETAIAPPYPLPEAWRGAWQSLAPTPGRPALAGRLVVPAPWDAPALWQP